MELTFKKREQGFAELLMNISCSCDVTYDRLVELAQAEKDGRLIVLPPVSKDTSAFQGNLDVFELSLAIKWAHAAALMDENPEVSHLFFLSEIALNEKLERLENGQPSSAPLTPEQLLEMDGEPVYIKRIGSDHPDDSAWALVDAQNGICRTGDGCKAFFMFYGKTWLAYRRKPEG